MPIIEKVGRKSWRVRALYAAMYFVLIIGGISMIYPFLVMLTASMTSTIDYNDFSAYPHYLTNDEQLFRKFAHAKYNSGYRGSLHVINRQYAETLLMHSELDAPAIAPEALANIVKDWRTVKSQLPPSYITCGFSKRGYEAGRAQIRFQDILEDQFDGDILAANRHFFLTADSFYTIYGPDAQPLVRDWLPENSDFAEQWREFIRTLPEYYHYVPNCDGLWQTFLSDHYQQSIDRMNEELRCALTDFQSVLLPASLKQAGVFHTLWLEFVRTRLPLRYIALSPEAASSYRQFLKTKYRDIDNLNSAYEARWQEFDNITLPDDFPSLNNQRMVNDLYEFLTVPDVAIHAVLTTPEIRYRQHLANTYASIEHLNQAYQSNYASFGDIPVHHRAIDWFDLQEHRGDWRAFFVSRNFRRVLNYIIKQDGALVNTLLFCAGMIIATLTINPMCAYALSRFNLSYTNNILIFLLATMAFPAEVALIPNFLLLRDLNLLNTYAALILPAVANGFSIFLLKGFFDSLPDELYEAATIDGAGEIRIFTQITMPLCKPVLAYMGLQAFTMAYQAFLFAMIVCPDPDRWTIMVFLYDMRTWATPSMQMAGMVIASVPTLLVFVFAQRVIMRGIVIPVEK